MGRTPMQVPDGFHDDGSSFDSQVACDNCGIVVTVGVEYGESYDEHECYSDNPDETRGVPANGF